MSHRTDVRGTLVALFVLASSQLATTCDLGTASGGDPGAALALWTALPSQQTVGQGSDFSIDFEVSTPDSFRAIEVNLSWDSALLEFVSAGPHPDFDDDGQLSLVPIVDSVAGTADGLVDARHVSSLVNTSARVVTVWFRGTAVGQASVTATGRIADTQGLASSAIKSTALVTVTP